MSTHRARIRLAYHRSPWPTLIAIATVMLTLVFVLLRVGLQVLATNQAAEITRLASLPFGN